LPNDGEQRPSTDRIVQRDGYGNGAEVGAFLKDAVAALLSHCEKAMRSSLRQTSSPERTRSLPNRDLDLGYEYLAVHTAADLSSVGHFEKRRQRLNEVGSRFLNG
jgi:hypothetical protein